MSEIENLKFALQRMLYREMKLALVAEEAFRTGDFSALHTRVKGNIDALEKGALLRASKNLEFSSGFHDAILEATPEAFRL